MKKLTPGRKRLVNNFITYGMVVAAYIVLQALNAGGMISPSLQGQLVPICAYVVMAVSLNLTVGFLGELSLGHAGFMSVGAFVGGILLGIIENLSKAYISTQLSDAIVFLVLVVVLIVKPTGLLGKKVNVKV